MSREWVDKAAVVRHSEDQMTMIDYTPGTDVPMGSIVLLGNHPVIATRDLVANKLGAVCAFGGVFMVQANAQTPTPGSRVAFDETGLTATGAFGGVAVSGVLQNAGGQDVVDVLFIPDGGTV